MLQRVNSSLDSLNEGLGYKDLDLLTEELISQDDICCRLNRIFSEEFHKFTKSFVVTRRAK